MPTPFQCVHHEWQWWIDPVGPIHVNELMHQHCNDYLVCCEVLELYSDEPVWLCHICTAYVLLGHNHMWSVGDLVWT